MFFDRSNIHTFLPLPPPRISSPSHPPPEILVLHRVRIQSYQGSIETSVLQRNEGGSLRCQKIKQRSNGKVHRTCSGTAGTPAALHRSIILSSSAPTCAWTTSFCEHHEEMERNCVCTSCETKRKQEQARRTTYDERDVVRLHKGDPVQEELVERFVGLRIRISFIHSVSTHILTQPKPRSGPFSVYVMNTANDVSSKKQKKNTS